MTAATSRGRPALTPGPALRRAVLGERRLRGGSGDPQRQAARPIVTFMADATSSFPTCQVPLTVLAWRHAGFPTDTTAISAASISGTFAKQGQRFDLDGRHGTHVPFFMPIPTPLLLHDHPAS